MKTGYFLVIHFLRTGSNLSMKTNKQGIFQGKCFFFFLSTICETECERKSFPENVSPDILHQNISEYFHLMGKTELRTNTPENVFMFTHEK